MVKTGSRIRLCVILLVLNVAFIWGNSLMTAEVSRAISSFVKTVLSFLLSGGGEQGQEGDHLLRKLAHFTEFACLLIDCQAPLQGFVKKDDTLLISGFGKFEAYDKNARKGRNPQTDESITLPPRKVVVFRLSRKFRVELNGGEEE